MFSFNSLIFCFPWSGAVSSDPWWEAFCLGLNQEGLGWETRGGKIKEKKEGRKTYLLAKPRAALTQHPSLYIIYSATETLIPSPALPQSAGVAIEVEQVTARQATQLPPLSTSSEHLIHNSASRKVP